jgi:hypothetical protein
VKRLVTVIGKSGGSWVGVCKSRVTLTGEREREARDREKEGDREGGVVQTV